MSERDAPLVLHQFAVSHFCEKVRWALDFKGLAWRANTLVPGPHARVARRLSGQRSVPVLSVGEGRALADSTAIIDALETSHPTPSLTPAEPALAAEARAWEERLDEGLGTAVRRLCYATLLDHRDVLLPLLTHGAPWYGRPMLRLAWPKLAPTMRRGFGIDAASVARARGDIEAALHELAEARGASAYLVGERFTRADLTAAALLAPLTREPLYPVAWPDPLPEPLRGDCERLAPELAWVSATYAAHRRPTRSP